MIASGMQLQSMPREGGSAGHRAPEGFYRRALFEEVAASLRRKILTQELQPGSRIDELALAAEYGISRTPMREALKVLAREGWVLHRVRRGCYVAAPDSRASAELLELVALLDGQAGSDIAHAAQPAQRESLWVWYRRQYPGHPAGNPAESQIEDSAWQGMVPRFLHKLRTLADNRQRTRLVENLYARLGPGDSSPQAELQACQAMLSALQARNAAQMEQVLRTWLLASYRETI